MPTVVVHVTVVESGTSFSIAVDPFILDLGPQADQVDIDWELTASGWDFTASGIDIETRGRTGRFRDNRKTAPGRFHWRRSFRDGASNNRYRYTINVERSSDGAEASLDPLIVNN